MTACFHLPSVVCENCAHLRSSTRRTALTDRTFTTTNIIVAPGRWLATTVEGIEIVNSQTDIRRFTVFRHGDLSATHDANQRNAPDVPQFEGVVFSDGTVAVRWLTAARSTSVWADFETMWKVHGHDDPTSKHGTVIVWHDGASKETP